MTFTKEDLRTFLIGLVAALGVTLGEMLITVEAQTDLGVWGRALLVGLLAAAGRYILTELARRGLR